jgi:hypothetical protein
MAAGGNTPSSCAPTFQPVWIRLARRLGRFNLRRMNFAPFWARGEREGPISWRWSFRSLDEAQTLAAQAAQHAAGEVAAIVTRNSYDCLCGCLVLNTARVMFADVGLPEPKRPGLFQRLFGKPAPRAAGPPGGRRHRQSRTMGAAPWRLGLADLPHPGRSPVAGHARLVRSGNGGIRRRIRRSRCIASYAKAQKCFRARRTPKPWRCYADIPPVRWPWVDEKAEAKFKRWEAEYQSESSDYATCELIRSEKSRPC